MGIMVGGCATPNTEVKLAGADGTARVTAWESIGSRRDYLSESPLSVKLSGLFRLQLRLHPGSRLPIREKVAD